MTRPVNAVFFGADGGIKYKPFPSLVLSGQFSVVRAKNRSDDSYLVLIPSDRLGGAFRYSVFNEEETEKAYISMSASVVAKQHRYELNADFSKPPDAYALIDLEVGGETILGNEAIKFSLQVSNLLDQQYRDYTSLLRYFADQPGRQFMLRVSIDFSSDKK